MTMNFFRGSLLSVFTYQARDGIRDGTMTKGQNSEETRESEEQRNLMASQRGKPEFQSQFRASSSKQSQ